MSKKSDSPYNMYLDLIQSSSEQNLNFSRPKSLYDNDRRIFEPDEEIETFFTEEEMYNEKNGIKDNKDEIKFNPVTGEIEETVYFHRRKKVTVKKYTEKELSNMREECKYTLIHDFAENDIYHVSDEERLKNDELAEIAIKIKGLRKGYRKVEQYIEAMRVAYQAWEILAKKYSLIYSRKDFFEGLSSGELSYDGFAVPTLRGIKNYNPKILAEYIQNVDLDPMELVKVDPREFVELPWDNDPEEYDNNHERLLSVKELNDIEECHSGNLTSTISISKMDKKYIPNFDYVYNKKRIKKLNKKDKLIADSIKTVYKSIQGNNVMFGNFMRYDDTYDKQQSNKSSNVESIRYSGSWQNDTKVQIFENIVHEEFLDDFPIQQKYQTFRDLEMSNLFGKMEEAGINVKEIRENISQPSSSEKKQTIKKERQENKRIERSIVSRVIAMNNNPKFKSIVKRVNQRLDNGDYYDEK